MDDRQIAEWALIENIQREDLNPIEKAHAIQQLVQKFDLNHEQVGQQLGMDRASISNLLRLLTLSDSVRQLVADGLLSMGQARAIAGLADGASQADVARQAVKQGLSVRQVEAMVRQFNASDKSSAKPGKAVTRNAHMQDIERQVAEQLGTRVAIRPGRKKGAGTLTLEFYSLQQFDDLLDRLRVKLD